MSLENLLKIGQLKEHPAQAEEIERLLVAAQRNLRDAQQKNISPETRFDAAYKAIMQSALAALMIHGYRPDTSRPGHHMTVLQSTPLTLGLPAKRTTLQPGKGRSAGALAGCHADPFAPGNATDNSSTWFPSSFSRLTCTASGSTLT